MSLTKAQAKKGAKSGASKRMAKLSTALVLFLLGFVVGYLGGVQNNTGLIYLSVVIWGCASALVLSIRK